ncbi:bystin [Impatiens glandulifera]|uniref:bystin n=1 Tax=Impatiens glandulifera TaxID=253017 RepID=UPI001FB0DD65|nr:bystin [Impatiens glandulifera]
MGNKRERHQNPEPFLPNVDATFSTASRKRNKLPKQHQEDQKLISSGLSSKILKEALLQQKEIQDETDNQNPAIIMFPEELPAPVTLDQEDDIDDFNGFDDTISHYDYDEAIDEEDELLLEAFMNKDAGPQRTLADIIVNKFKERDAKTSSGGVGHAPKIDDSVIEIYKSIGILLSKYTAGKLPKAFKHIPSMALWEQVLHLTEPQKWSPNAMYQATRIFASSNSRKAERFYKLVLLPRVRQDIAENKKLHFALYASLKKSLYKPAAFNKGILFPLCESKTCTLREAVIVGSVITKVSIPPLHSSAALLTLTRMEYYGTTSYFIKLFTEKKYALPYRVLDALVSHFLKFVEDERTMPVIWHQSLLAFVQRYKNELTKEDKENLKYLVEKQRHKEVTPEIHRELDNSRNRGEKEDVEMPTLNSVINNPINEDRFDIPDVPMEED